MRPNSGSIYRLTGLEFLKEGSEIVARFSLSNTREDPRETGILEELLNAHIDGRSHDLQRSPTKKEFELFYMKKVTADDEDLQSFLKEGMVKIYRDIGLRLIQDNGSGHYFTEVLVLDRTDGVSFVVARW